MRSSHETAPSVYPSTSSAPSVCADSSSYIREIQALRSPNYGHGDTTTVHYNAVKRAENARPGYIMRANLHYTNSGQCLPLCMLEAKTTPHAVYVTGGGEEG